MIGNVETLEPSLPATVSTNVDEEQDIVYFNFGIPKGDKGDTGNVNYGGFEVENGMLKVDDGEGHIYYLGTVAMEPKGAYDNTVSYEKLNTVLYNDSTYMAIKPTLGNLPTDTEYWQLIGGGLTRDDIVDNLNSNDATKMLSAKQGKVIDAKLEGKTSYFDTIATMKAGDLKAGNLVETKGYYAVNDGGGAKYEIVDDNTLTDDGAYIHELTNGLFARMIIKDNMINFKQFGAKPDDDTFDCKPYMDKYVALCRSHNITYKLYIPVGIWYFSPTLISRYNGVNIVGEPIFPRENFSGTVIAPISNTTQNYIWKLGGKEDITDLSTVDGITVTQAHMEGLTFTTFRDNVSKKRRTTYACFYIDLCDFCTFRDIYVDQFVGNGLAIRSSWELTFNSLLFRHQEDPTCASLLFDRALPITSGGSNISALEIDYLMFEANDGKYIYSHPLSSFGHNHIGHINIETGFQSGTMTNLTANEDTSTYTPIDMISGFFRMTIIDSINLVYNSPKKTVIDGTTYYLRSIIASDTSDANVSDDYSKRSCLSVGSILYRTENTSHMSVYYVYNSYFSNSCFNIGQITLQDHLPAVPIINANGGHGINIGSVVSTGLLSFKQNYDNRDIFHNVLRNMIYYDKTAPSQLGLVYALNTSASNTNIAKYTNYQYSPSDNPKTFHFICKNTGTLSLNIMVYTTIGGTGGNSSVSVPVNNNEWQEVTLTRASDIGTDITIANANQRPLTIAKVWYE